MSPQTPRPTKGLTERPEVRRVPKRSSLLPLGLRLLCAGVRQRDLAETASEALPSAFLRPAFRSFTKPVRPPRAIAHDPGAGGGGQKAPRHSC